VLDRLPQGDQLGAACMIGSSKRRDQPFFFTV